MDGLDPLDLCPTDDFDIAWDRRICNQQATLWNSLPERILRGSYEYYLCIDLNRDLYVLAMLHGY